MQSSRSASILLLLACMCAVAFVRTLPRSLGGVAAPAVERVRTAIADELRGTSTDLVEPAAIDRWIVEHPSEYAAKVDTEKAALTELLTFTGADGRLHPYLGDYDSYLWLRLARNELQTGNVCDEIVDGVCRDTLTHAPVGRNMIYDKSLHIDAIVALHRLITTFAPDFPLSSTSFFVPVVVGTLGVIPAFFVGRRFGGFPGAVAAALVTSLNPSFLTRSFGSDNDVWNVVVLLFSFWFIVEALAAEALRPRLVFTLLAAAAVGIHAAIWRGWLLSHVVVEAGILATLGYACLRSLVQQRDLRLWRDRRVQAVLTVAAVYFGAAAVTTWIGGSEPGFVQWHVLIAEDAFLPEEEDREFNPEGLWPKEFASVAEIRALHGGDVTLFTTNVPLLLLAFFGVTLAVLGPLPWRVQHWVVAAVGALAIGYAYSGATSDYRVAGWVLFAPIVLGALVALISPRQRDDLERGALVLVICLGAAFMLGPRASRFVMFFAVPVGVGAAILAGWMYRTLVELLQARAGAALATAAAVASVVALVAYPVYRGYVIGRDYLPPMDDAWWKVFADIKDASPTDAIVNLWWDEGHWAKYIGERRVIADGASLSSHILYWFTHAMLASDDARAAGILRMLACGSDATPFVEGSLGAYGKLRAAGLPVIEAHSTIEQLVAVDRSAAERLLTARGIAPDAVAGILESTHCTPPPLYVVLTDQLSKTAGWGAGLWDFRRAYVARRARKLPREEAMRELTQNVGYSNAEARQLLREASALDGDDRLNQFVSPELGFLTKTWITCTPDAKGLSTCSLSSRVAGGKQTLDAFQYPLQSPAAGRLRIRQLDAAGASTYSFRTPGEVVIAGEDSFSTAKVPRATDPALAVLIDAPGRRMLMAESALLTSMFTRLAFLDGRGLTHFEKLGEYRSLNQRLVSYRVLP